MVVVLLQQLLIQVAIRDFHAHQPIHEVSGFFRRCPLCLWRCVLLILINQICTGILRTNKMNEYNIWRTYSEADTHRHLIQHYSQVPLSVGLERFHCISVSVLRTVANKVPGEAQQRGCVLRTGQVGGKPSITPPTNLEVPCWLKALQWRL